MRSGVAWPSAVFTVRSVAQLFPRESAVSLPLVTRTRFWLSELNRPPKIDGNGK